MPNEFDAAARDLTPQVGIVFKKPFSNEEGDKFFVKVYDLFPDMEDTHIEGRRVVNVSIEMFDALVRQAGYEPVNPTTGQTKTEEEAV